MKCRHSLAVNAQVCVAPRQPLLVTDDIADGDVHDAHIAHVAVNDHNLAVIAPIDTKCELHERQFEVRMNLDARSTHFLQYARTEIERTHLIIEHPHLYPLARLVHEHLDQLGACLVVLKDEILNMDVVTSGTDVTLQSLKLIVTRREDFNVIAHKQMRTYQLVDQRDDLTRVIRQIALILNGIGEISHTSQFSQMGLGNQAHTFQAAAEDEVYHQTQNRQQNQHKHPCHGLDGVTVLAEHHNNHREHSEDIQHHQDVVYYVSVWKQLCEKHNQSSIQ